MADESLEYRPGSHRRTPAIIIGAVTTVVVVAGLYALSQGTDRSRGTFSEHVGEAFEECNPAEIRFLAGKHNFMTAFEPCGSNNLVHYAWSPDGTHLYFQLTMTARIMDAEADNKANFPLPIETPTGAATWLTNTRIAVPQGPLEEGGAERVVVFDLDSRQLIESDLPGVFGATDLQRGDSPSEIFFTASPTPEAERRIYQLDLDTGSVTPAFDFVEGPVESFTYTPDQHAIVVGSRGEVWHYDRTASALQNHWTGLRGALHPEGRWMMLEDEGEEVSIFYQRSWDELSENARRRELSRAERFEERLPEWYPRSVKPPGLSIIDLQSGERWMFTGFQGTQFQWYDAMDYYASIVLWGFEGKELNRNVLLGNLADRLRSIERGEEMLGVKRWQVHSEDAAAVSPPGEVSQQ